VILNYCRSSRRDLIITLYDSYIKKYDEVKVELNTFWTSALRVLIANVQIDSLAGLPEAEEPAYNQ
jgi:hypothetical protein